MRGHELEHSKMDTVVVLVVVGLVVVAAAVRSDHYDDGDADVVVDDVDVDIDLRYNQYYLMFLCILKDHGEMNYYNYNYY
jgi:hypothetical protein